MIKENYIYFDNTCNTRHLGNYETKENNITKPFSFIRSDSPDKMSEKDINKLIDLGIGAVIDFRSEREINKENNLLINNPKIKYYNIPLMGNSDSGIPPHLLDMKNFDMGDFYVYILKDVKDGLKKVFDIILNEDNGVFFNCAVGKDRTGTVAALILMLAQVDEEIIVKEYSVTRENLAPLLPELTKGWDKEKFGEVSNEIINKTFASEPEFIQKAINYINEEENGIINYFKSLGFSLEEIKKIKSRIV